jgi:hypothetical protein
MTATSPTIDPARAEDDGSTRRPAFVRSLAGRAVLVGVGAIVALTVGLREPAPAKGDRRAAVAELLSRRGLVVEPDDVTFVDGPRGLAASAFGTARVLCRVRSAAGEPSDLFLYDARLSPTGALLSVSSGRNLSETTGADESRAVVVGDTAAYVSESVVAGAPSVVTVLDFAGQAKQSWPAVERAQNAVTNLQQTGQLRGLARHTFVIAEEGEIGVTAEGDAFVAHVGGKDAVLSHGAKVAADLPAWITHESDELARPGNVITWSVDRVRNEIGDENMQAIKQVAFTALDFVERNREEITGDTGEASIAEDLGESELAAPQRQIPVDPDLGWPPPPLEPWVTPALPGEGQWNAKEDPAFFRNQPNLPPTFVTTFIRSDQTRKATRVYVVVWDPRQVELHMMAGTVEPKGATGKAGPGLIPRTPDVLKRVVAASNAGFQALHGEYGMMADGVVYLPPKPYGATVARLRDGSTAFGTWPDDATVPDTVLSYRQNMTVMVQDEKFNPYDRTWWGGTVPGAEDKTHTVRTGICLTREKFVAYFYGADLSPNALAQAMIQTRCSYGIALDMNAGHSGLEFYRVDETALLPPLSRGIETSWEAEGSVPDMPGYSFRAKRFIKGMGLMNFPRYIKREARDYFYLTLRHVLPGTDLPIVASGAPALEGEGTWRVKDLPQNGFPYAMATTRIRPDASDPAAVFRVLSLDPRTMSVATKDGEGKTTVAFDAGETTGDLSLYYSGRAFTIADASPQKGAARLVSGPAKLPEGAGVLCVQRDSGMLFYAEVDGAEGGKRGKLGALVDYLDKQVGCEATLSLAAPLAAVLGDNTTLAGAASHLPKGAGAVRMVRADAPGGTRFFENTPIVPRDVWYPLQQHRVRYFKKQD